jgi:hypothetical protein
MGIEIDSKRGVATSYGVRSTTGQYGSQESTKMGAIKSAMWTFAHNTLPTANTSKLQYVIPANATIVSARLIVDTAFTGGTSYTVGLQTAAGTAIDDDGLLTAAQLTVASNHLTEGKVIVGSGALVGTTIGSTAGELVVIASGTFTGGTGRIIVEYIYNK